jgi:hypothetical protein
MTFEAAGHTGPEKYYQGLHFRWGSLIGISSNESFTASTLLFRHDSSQPAAAGVAWNNNMPPTYGGTLTNDRSYNYPYAHDDFSNYRGDICKYISRYGNGPGGHWRLPVSNEFGVETLNDEYHLWPAAGLKFDWYVGMDDTNAPAKFQSVASSDPYGRQALTYASGAGIATNHEVIFPASGYRSYASGSIEVIGTYGFYASGSANGNYCHMMTFLSSHFAPALVIDRTSTVSVRCVKD